MDKTEDGKITSGEHISYWIDSIAPISFQQLNKNLKTEVVIVGGGIAGVTTAYCLAKSGKKVVLVEDGNIGSGESGRTTAHLVTALDDRYYELEKIYGIEKTRLIAQSHQTAIDFIEQTALHLKLECDFERLFGYLFLHPTDKRDSLERELKAAREAGLEVEELPHLPGTKAVVPCIRFSGQAQFHPLKYLRGLCDAIVEMGGKIFTGTHALKIDHTGIESKDGYKVEAEHVVVATNSPVNNKYVINLKQFPFRTYVIGVKVKKGSIPKALWWDTGDYSENAEIPPYHYIRIHELDEEHDLLICGGEDHPTGIADEDKINEEDRYGLLQNWLKQYFPADEIVYQWSGQVMEPNDSLAYIGRNPLDRRNVFIATGDSGNGMTHGTIAGLLITDLINGKNNEWEIIYNPGRFKIPITAKTYFSELGERIVSPFKKNHPHHNELNQIPENEGRIVETKDGKFAVYRDENTNFHIVDAVCMHLGCTVKWNNDEKSWDCPCHGSRYTYEGVVVNGPSNKNLANYTSLSKTKEIEENVTEEKH